MAGSVAGGTRSRSRETLLRYGKGDNGPTDAAAIETALQFHGNPETLSLPIEPLGHKDLFVRDHTHSVLKVL